MREWNKSFQKKKWPTYQQRIYVCRAPSLILAHFLIIWPMKNKKNNPPTSYLQTDLKTSYQPIFFVENLERSHLARTGPLTAAALQNWNWGNQLTLWLYCWGFLSELVIFRFFISYPRSTHITNWQVKFIKKPSDISGQTYHKWAMHSKASAVIIWGFVLKDPETGRVSC